MRQTNGGPRRTQLWLLIALGVAAASLFAHRVEAQTFTSERVTCVFCGSSTSQSCYTTGYFFTGVGTATGTVYAYTGETLTWKSTCSGAATVVETITGGAKSLVFACGGAPTSLLNVAKGGTGSGTVTSNPSGITCGATCSASYPACTPVVLTATPSAGSTFLGWSSAECSGTSTCTVAMTQATNVTANFGGGTSGGTPGAWVLPSSAFRGGANGAEFHTDARILNLGASQVTVTATLYDQASGTAVPAAPFSISGKSQAAFDNILELLFGKTLSQGAYGPIRFDSTGPIAVSSSVNNVNACGTGATSGQWLPGIDAKNAMNVGAIPQLAVSANPSAGYRSNLVVMNPGASSTTATVNVRAGNGALLASGTIGPLGPNGFSQVALDSAATFPGVAGRTDSNLWVDFTSDRPVLAFASVINNASGDPFAVVATPDMAGGGSGSWLLPSSAFRGGANGAEFHTDVRILNLSSSAVTVTATLYDQATGATVPAAPFSVPARSQAAFDNILQSLFGKNLSQGAYGPIRFASSGPIVVSSSVNNVNACGTGATSGQWLPGIHAPIAMTSGVVPHLAVSANASSGYRTNLVVMNPGSSSATATLNVRAGGTLLSSGTIGPLGANGFSQVALDSAGTFPGVAGRTDSNLWLELTSNQPLLAFASVINNASGDPFAVVATPTSLNVTGTFSGRSDDGPMSLTLTQTGSSVSGYGSVSLPYPYPQINVGVTGTVNGTTLTLEMQDNGGCYYKFPGVWITSATDDVIAGSYSAPLVCSGNTTNATSFVVRQ